MSETTVFLSYGAHATAERGACAMEWKRDPLGRRIAVPWQERFAAFAPSSGDGCWLWRGMLTDTGYGILRVGTRMVRAHRMAWQIATGSEVPSGNVVMHTCDTPRCVNPAHLRVGTQAENNQDRASKGRSRGTFSRGVAHPRYNPESRHHGRTR